MKTRSPRSENIDGMLLHHRQKSKSLLPLLALLTSTDGGLQEITCNTADCCTTAEKLQSLLQLLATSQAPMAQHYRNDIGRRPFAQALMAAFWK